MNRKYLLPIPWCVLALAALGWAGCAQKTTLDQHLKTADQNYHSNQYERAEIEYLNALKIDPNNAEANSKLAQLLFEEGRIGNALPFLRRAKELQPEVLVVQIRLAQAYINFGQTSLARDGILQVLARDPSNPEALLLLADASTSPNQIDQAVALYSKVNVGSPAQSAALVAHGSLELRRRNSAAAESLFNAALEIDSKSAAAHAGLAALNWGKRDIAKAEKEFSAVAELLPPRAQLRLKPILFHIEIGAKDRAKAELLELNKLAPDYIPALVLLTQVTIDQGDYKQAAALLGQIRTRDPRNPDAQLEQARLYIAQERFDVARTELEKLASAHPRSARIFYYLALAQLGEGRTEDAVSTLNRALSFDTNLTDATVLLAGIQIQRKNYGSAIPSLQQLCKTRPDLAQPKMLLAGALLGADRADEALAVYEDMLAAFPANPQVSWLIALAQEKKGDHAKARAALDRAIAVNPNYLPAIEQEIRLDLSEGKVDSARTRTTTAIATNTKVSQLYIILSEVEAASKNPRGVEDALRTAISLAPDSTPAYYALAQHYLKTNQTEQALVHLNELLAKNPKDIEGLMLSGVIEEQSHKYDNARSHYEQVLALNPKFYGCLNNLAYLYSEQFNLIDKAYAAATKARELQPNDPNVSDTFGWVLYKRGQYAWANGILRQSASKLPQNAEAQFHSGIAAYAMSEEDSARAALESALRLDPALPFAKEARDTLNLLAISLVSPPPETRGMIEQRLSVHPNDVGSLLRLAALKEKAGNTPDAVSALLTAQKANPENFAPPLALARLYRSHSDSAKALDAARTARKIAPGNSDVTWELGCIADECGDHSWAVSLLEESAGGRPEDPQRALDLVLALYHVGRAKDAQAMLGPVLRSNVAFDRKADAVRYSGYLEYVADQNNTSATLPNGLPEREAAIANAIKTWRTGDRNMAITLFEKILEKDPQLFPAQENLALLYAEVGRSDKIAVDLATQARLSQPDNIALTKALASMLYSLRQYDRVIALLDTSTVRDEPDGRVLFWLGMSKYERGDFDGSRKALTAAQRYPLFSKFADDCRATLAKLETKAGHK